MLLYENNYIFYVKQTDSKIREVLNRNRFFETCLEFWHQLAFYRGLKYDNTIFDNDFSRILSLYRFSPPPKYRPKSSFMKIDYFSRKTPFLRFGFLTHLTDAYETVPGPSSGAEIKSPRVF